MPKFTPWTLLRRRIHPIAVELSKLVSWQIAKPQTIATWVAELTHQQMLLADYSCILITLFPLKKHEDPVDVAQAIVRDDERCGELARPSVEVMHRLLFAIDLSYRMSPGWRKEVVLNGDLSHDLKAVLVNAWKTNKPYVWARQFGMEYELDSLMVSSDVISQRQARLKVGIGGIHLN